MQKSADEEDFFSFIEDLVDTDVNNLILELNTKFGLTENSYEAGRDYINLWNKAVTCSKAVLLARPYFSHKLPNLLDEVIEFNNFYNLAKLNDQTEDLINFDKKISKIITFILRRYTRTFFRNYRYFY